MRTERSEHRRDVQLDFQQFIASNFCHPYNKNFNKFLFCFSKFIQTVNIENIDPELSRLYLLSTHQEDEDPIKFLGTGMGAIRTWLYLSVANWITTMTNTFDRSRPIDGDRFYQNSYTSCSDTDSLGYTIKMAESLRTHIRELIVMVEKGESLDDPIFRQKLQYKLEITRIDLQAAYKRHKRITDEYLYGQNHEKMIIIGETMPIADIVSPILGIIDTAPVTIQESGEFYREMEKRYAPIKLKIYGMILEILSGLRSTWSESLTHQSGPYGFCLDNGGDPTYGKLQRSSIETWIDSLPSYRPEFVVTLNNFQQFPFQERHENPVQNIECSLKFLKSLSCLTE